MVKYILKFKNLIVTRTFSKALGLASIRIGVLIGNKNIIKELYKVKLVHEITGVAAKIGMYIMDNKKLSMTMLMKLMMENYSFTKK